MKPSRRLLVIQVEKRFGAEGDLSGIIPKSYQDADFKFDRLYRGSALILTGIALFLYLKTLFKFRAGALDSNLIVVVGLLYSLFATAVAYCVAELHTSIRSYYSSKAELLIDGKELDEARREEVENQWRGAAASYGWLWPGVVVLTTIFVAFDLLPGRPAVGGGALGCIAIAIQIAVLVLFAIIIYGKGEKYSWWLHLLLYLLILVSAMLLLSPEYSLLLSPTSSRGSPAIGG